MYLWEDWFSLNDETIDKQHKMFIDQINFLERMGDQQPTDTDVINMIIFLQDYSHKHFDSEEAYMKLHNYPDQAKHQQIHADFSRRVDELYHQLKQKNNPKLIATEISIFMGNWLIHHIKHVDHALGVYATTGERLPI